MWHLHGYVGSGRLLQCLYRESSVKDTPPGVDSGRASTGHDTPIKDIFYRGKACFPDQYQYQLYAHMHALVLAIPTSTGAIVGNGVATALTEPILVGSSAQPSTPLDACGRGVPCSQALVQYQQQ